MKFICKLCKYETNDKSNFVKHEKSYKHSKLSRGESLECLHECPICSYSTKLKQNYNRHYKNHKRTWVLSIMSLAGKRKKALNNAIIIRNRNEEKANEYEDYARFLASEIESIQNKIRKLKD